jgi:hypothetical protein
VASVAREAILSEAELEAAILQVEVVEAEVVVEAVAELVMVREAAGMETAVAVAVVHRSWPRSPRALLSRWSAERCWRYWPRVIVGESALWFDLSSIQFVGPIVDQESKSRT